jgi:hypothetical protein
MLSYPKHNQADLAYLDHFQFKDYSVHLFQSTKPLLLIMAFPTIPAFISSTKSWEDVRHHPAMAWMEKCTAAWDSGEAKKGPYTDWFTEDFTYRKPSGETYERQEAWEKLLEAYVPAAAHKHEPAFCVVWDWAQGWHMIGQANVYFNLPVPGNEKKFTDLSGEKWDVCAPGMFHFQYKRVPGASNGGIRICAEEVSVDTAPLIVAMLKRGMIKPEMLTG